MEQLQDEVYRTGGKGGQPIGRWNVTTDDSDDTLTPSRHFILYGSIPAIEANSGLFFFLVLGGFDEFPEFGIFLEGLIFTGADAGAEEKILEGMAAEDAVDEDAEAVAFEINAVVADAITVEDVAVAFEFAEIFEFIGHDMLGEAAEITEDLKLQFLGHLGQFGGTGGRENDLERVHVTRGEYILFWETGQ